MYQCFANIGLLDRVLHTHSMQIERIVAHMHIKGKPIKPHKRHTAHSGLTFSYFESLRFLL